MNKKEAAQYLEVSERAIERYTASGKLHPTYIKGRTGQAPDFDEKELEELKRQMKQGPTVKPINTADKSDKGGSATTDIARRPSKDVMKSEDLLQIFAQAMQQRNEPGPGVEIKDKLMLTLSEASALSGAPRAMLKRAIDDRKLKAILSGRYLIKRTDLDSFIKSL